MDQNNLALRGYPLKDDSIKHGGQHHRFNRQMMPHSFGLHKQGSLIMTEQKQAPHPRWGTFHWPKPSFAQTVQQFPTSATEALPLPRRPFFRMDGGPRATVPQLYTAPSASSAEEALLVDDTQTLIESPLKKRTPEKRASNKKVPRAGVSRTTSDGAVRKSAPTLNHTSPVPIKYAGKDLWQELHACNIDIEDMCGELLRDIALQGPGNANIARAVKKQHLDLEVVPMSRQLVQKRLQEYHQQKHGWINWKQRGNYQAHWDSFLKRKQAAQEAFKKARRAKQVEKRRWATAIPSSSQGSSKTKRRPVDNRRNTQVAPVKSGRSVFGNMEKQKAEAGSQDSDYYDKVNEDGDEDQISYE